ncbi:sensor histidine kinase [Belnapia arida]|uniref:sensor histidine kinase n=1 Tax=Belnapia arida TaxID=2804533 RepID=UPI00192E02F5|nr:HWE histidine kinase domain-containing protein [Belnapia arida]
MAAPRKVDTGAHPSESQNGKLTSLQAYLVTFVLLALAPALLLGALTTWELGQAYRQAEEAGLTSTAQALATALDREVEIAATALTTLAASPLLGAGDIAGTYPQAAAVGRAFGGWVALLEADSQQIFNTLKPLGAELPRGSGGSHVGRAIASERPVVSDLFTGATARQPVVAVFQPLPLGTAGAAPEGSRVLLLAFSPKRLSALLERQELGHAGGFAVLTDGNHSVLARSSEHGRFLGQLSPAWFIKAVTGQDRGLVRGGTALAGHEAVAAFQRLEVASSWVVTVTLPYAPYRGRWHGPMLRYAIGAALLSAAAAAVAALLAQRLLRPLQALARDADRLRQGDDPASSQPERIAELEALRRALWRAVEALRARATAEGRATAAEEATTELCQAARWRELLVHELNHRVKNVLATVQSLALQTLRGTRGEPDRFVHDFTGRLRSLARAHDLLTARGWEGAPLDALVAAALAPWRGGERIAASGPEQVYLTSHQAQALALALHELATNAAKYGALSRPEGRVTVFWARRPQNAGGQEVVVELTWAETGGPVVTGVPERCGFGTRLLERGLSSDLGPDSSVVLQFKPEGLRALLRFRPYARPNQLCA